MRSIKAKLKKPAANSSKDDWSKLDQRIWHSVAINQPAKLASKLHKHESLNVNKIYPSVGYSVVHYAAAKGLDDCLNVLLAHKANVSTRDATGATPLHASARYGHKGTTTKLLASRTVDVNARDNNQCTALHFASFEGHIECVKLIADENGSDIHCVDKEGRTSLMVASAMGRLAVCQELIRRGINVNHKDSSALQHTALSLAAEAGHADVVRLLCENGADYMAKLSDGRTALDIARTRSRRGVIDALHIIQLTEAAKKTDRGARLSTSSKLSDKQEDHAYFEKQAKQKSPHESNAAYTDELHVGSQHNISPSKHEEVRLQDIKPTVTDSRGNTTVLSLYNDSKHSNLYDRDVSIYDSKSTLASISSLDVSAVNESHNKSYHVENTSLPSQAQKSEINSKQSLLLAEELAHKEEQILLLDAQLKEVMTANRREMESLKQSNAKYEKSVQELEKANDSLAKECQDLHVAKEVAVTQIQQIQVDCDKLAKSEVTLKETQRKLSQTEVDLGNSTSKVDELTRQNKEIMSVCRQEQEKSENIHAELKHLLVDIGNPDDCDDYEECLRLLKYELLQASEKSARKTEAEEENRIELEQYQNKVLEQDDEIQALKSQLNEAESTLERHRIENEKLVLTVQDIKEKLQHSEGANSHHVTTNAHLKGELLHLQEQLAANELSDAATREAVVNLEETVTLSEQMAKEFESERSVWQTTESRLQDEANVLNNKLNDAKQTGAENEKIISDLRGERNQREAKITKLEKDLQKVENKKKEVEVETNRARQQLTEAKQKCSKLQDDVSSLRKSKKELSAKLNSVKIYECTESERKKIDSMKLQLEQLCKHIQESEKKYKETISVYRGHLLKAAKGELNPDVLVALKEILKLREEPHSSGKNI